MQAAAQPGISSRLKAGRLEGIGVPDLLWSLSRARATGALHLTAGNLAKRVFFSDGRIIFAASNDPDDRLGEVLLRQGTIRLEAFERAVARLPEGRRLGTILVEAGQLAPEQLVRGVLDQVRHIVTSLLPWEDGDYEFDPSPLPTEEIVTLNIDTASILLQGMRSIRSFQRIRRSVGPPSARYRAVDGWREAVAELDTTDGDRQLLERVDGAGETIDRLCREVFLSNFEIYQSLWAFTVLGLVRECGQAVESPMADPLTEGRLDRDGLAKMLVTLSRTIETGVLFVRRAGAERSFHFREGHLVFATSNKLDDGLVAYLLRRGMISMRDREETARRLLSSKRVGRILLEMNVIEEQELAKLVREHQTEIVFDTFRWEDGDWSWASGELPTIEEIVLERTIEDVVFAGTCHVTSWPRVREGCGGLSTRLALTPHYLEILDRMSVGTDDWDLITMLRAPATPLDLCRSSSLGDFRVCQTLWALRLLGAVDEAPLENALEAAFGSMGAASDDAPLRDEIPAAPEADPVPIAPAAVEAGADFEVTTVVEMTPEAPVADETIPTSTWTEPAQDASRPWEWRGSADTPAVEVSSATDGAELISEPWRLAGDEARPAEPPQEEAQGTEPGTAAEGAAFDMVPEQEAPDGDELPMGRARTGVAELFQIPAPDLEARHDFAMDLQGTEPEDPPRSEASALGDPSAADDDLDRPTSIPSDEIEETLRGTSPSEADAPASDTPPWEPEAASSEPDETFSGSAAEALSESTWEDAPVPGSGTAAEPAWDAPAKPERDALPDLPWDPPPDLDSAVAQLVARHRVVFRVIRSEVGAGAANFVRSCRSVLDDGLGELLGVAEMQPDGAWDPAELRKLVCERRLTDAPRGFRRLIEHEVATLRTQIGERRTRALLDQIEYL